MRALLGAKKCPVFLVITFVFTENLGGKRSATKHDETFAERTGRARPRPAGQNAQAVAHSTAGRDGPRVISLHIWSCFPGAGGGNTLL